jgi:putative cardiolipin synthase
MTSQRSATQKELFVVSPYFVPTRAGVEGFSELAARGIDVSVVTNSLAANNQSMVHGGYVPWRKTLLRNGVKIYEVRADADVRGSDRGQRLRAGLMRILPIRGQL